MCLARPSWLARVQLASSSSCYSLLLNRLPTTQSSTRHKYWLSVPLLGFERILEVKWNIANNPATDFFFKCIYWLETWNLKLSNNTVGALDLWQCQGHGGHWAQAEEEATRVYKSQRTALDSCFGLRRLFCDGKKASWKDFFRRCCSMLFKHQEQLVNFKLAHFKSFVHTHVCMHSWAAIQLA